VTYVRVHTVLDAAGADSPIPEAAVEVRLLALPPSQEAATSLVSRMRTAAGAARRLTAFSLADLCNRAAHGWSDLPTIVRELKTAGCDDLAELPVDLIEGLAEVVRLARGGGLPLARFTVDRPAGDRRADVIRHVRSLQETLGGVVRFAPLPRRPAADVPTTGYDDLRTVALARLAFGHLVGTPQAVSIEVDWTLYGPKLAQVALMFGADHLDGVSAASDTSLGLRRGAVQDVERNIRAAGFEPIATGPRA
jgi:aminodeoxyfutalosine synthase